MVPVLRPAHPLRPLTLDLSSGSQRRGMSCAILRTFSSGKGGSNVAFFL